MFKRYLKIILLILLVALPLSCKKEKKEETMHMKGSVNYDFPEYVMVGQKVHSYMSGITYPKDVKYKWVSDGLNISKNDTVISRTLDFTVGKDVGTFTLIGYAVAEGYYTMSKYTTVRVLSPSGSSVSGIEESEKIFEDERDGEKYYVQDIGDLQWFTQNLRYAGDTANVNPALRDTLGSAYQHSEKISLIFGRLYSWNDATGGKTGSGLAGGPQGACPEGWSVPTKEDWLNLANAVSSQKIEDYNDYWEGVGEALSAKIKLNEESMWPYSPDNLHKNTFGWNGIPSGNSKDDYQDFENIAKYGMWWTAAESDGGKYGCYRYMYYNNSYFIPHQIDKNAYGMSVRCVKLIEKP